MDKQDIEDIQVEDIKLEDIKITITDTAKAEIALIKENDFTLEENARSFRLSIDGKGCNGFDYAMGFGIEDEKDFIYTHNDVTVRLDRFTAFYCKEGTIDYIKDYANNTEGFHFENGNQKNYRGKFFKDESKVPKNLS